MLRAVSAVLAAAATAGFVGGAHAQTDGPARPLGIVSAKLVRLDAETLRPLPGAGIAVGSGGCASRQGGRACWTVPPWTFSPDASQLAVVRNDASSVRLVDVRRMRVRANVPLRGGPVGAVAWLTRGRLLALQESESGRQRLVAVDLATRRVAARRALGGSVVQLARAPGNVVMLLAPADTIGAARVAVADGRGAVRFAPLERILAGAKILGTGSAHRAEMRTPGLAVDPQGRRAFVVDTTLVAEIDLTSLAVEYHALERPASLLEPEAREKQVSGYARTARWLGANVLAVTGTDSDETRMQPSGLLFVDTRNWRVRGVEPLATRFVVAGSLVLATGGTWDPATGRATGIGVAAYGFDGERRFRLLDGETAWVAGVHGGRAYVGGSGNGPLSVVELPTGRVVGKRTGALPWLIQGVASGWWG